MITLDLLPIKEKKQLYIKKGYEVVKKIINTSLIHVALISFILVGASFLLDNDTKHITKQNEILLQSNKGLNSEIKKYNSELTYLITIQKEHINFSETIIIISNLVPSGVILSGLTIEKSIDNKNFILEISGVAESRDDLINFRELLNAQNFIEKFEVPIENLLKQKNIEFNFSTVIYLKKD